MSVFPDFESKRQPQKELVESLRSGNDNLSIDELLVEFGVLALLVGGGDQSVALILEPLADAKLVLSGSEKLGDLVALMLAYVVFSYCGKCICTKSVVWSCGR